MLNGMVEGLEEFPRPRWLKLGKKEGSPEIMVKLEKHHECLDYLLVVPHVRNGPVTIAHVYIEAEGSNKHYPTIGFQYPRKQNPGGANDGVIEKVLIQQLERDNATKKQVKVPIYETWQDDGTWTRTYECRDMFHVRAVVVTQQGMVVKSGWYLIPFPLFFCS